MKLELTDQECEVLLELLETAHRGTIHELHHTDAAEYKRLLKEKQRIIEEMISKVALHGATASMAGT
jgi:hypothetical protein